MSVKKSEPTEYLVSSDLFKLIGRIVMQARSITGGKDINGFPVREASIRNIGVEIDALRDLLDEYDRAIMQLHMESKRNG